MTSYTILNVTPTSTDSEVRAAYEHAIKLFPPDSAPEAFQRIVAAYEHIQDEEARFCYDLALDHRQGQETPSPVETTVAYFRADLTPTPPSEEAFMNFLKA